MQWFSLPIWIVDNVIVWTVELWNCYNCRKMKKNYLAADFLGMNFYKLQEYRIVVTVGNEIVWNAVVWNFVWFYNQVLTVKSIL